MTRFIRLSAMSVTLFAASTLVGCSQDALVEDTPEQAAEEAVGITEEQGGTTRTVEQQDEVLVRETTEVIDRDTGQVLDTEETVTPVTVTKEKTVETDVNVNTGETTTRVE